MQRVKIATLYWIDLKCGTTHKWIDAAVHIIYEFVGLPESKLNMRALPRPYHSCYDWRHEECGNSAIVSGFKEVLVTEVVTVSPDFLQLPLEGNKLYCETMLRFFKAFVKRYHKRVAGNISKGPS